mgnify:CR=1 FL=1
MTAARRRDEILQALAGASGPVSAAALAARLGVSRQVVVGDVALLRAAGSPIVATPRGYVLGGGQEGGGVRCTVACRHGLDGLLGGCSLFDFATMALICVCLAGAAGDSTNLLNVAIFSGAMVGGLVVGVIETFSAGYISSGYRDAIAFAILVAVILIKPSGIFGKKIVEKM